MQPTPRQRLGIASVSIALGVFLFVVATEVIPGLARQSGDAPRTIIALCGIVFVIAGCMALAGTGTRRNDLLAALLCFVFGVIGSWVAFFAPGEGFSGGLPLVSRDANVSIGRVVFGCGALLCFAISAWALHLYLRGAARDDERTD